MFATDSFLEMATKSPGSTFIHVGAGRGAVLDRYARLKPSKVVLVEGDPEAAAALKRAALPFGWAQVISGAVAAEDGELPWNRYNLAMLNGPVAADPLLERYPRLHCLGVTSVTATSLSALLRTATENGDASGSTVLLLDVPGQESALLHSIRDQLRTLTAIVVRGCVEPRAGTTTWPSLLEQMQEFSWELVSHETTRGPAWPVALFRFDPERHRVRMLRTQVESLTRQLEVRQGHAGPFDAPFDGPFDTPFDGPPQDSGSSGSSELLRTASPPRLRGPASDALDRLLESVDARLASAPEVGWDEQLLAEAEGCLIEMTSQPAQPKLVLNRIQTSTGPLTLLHAADDYIPTKVARDGCYYELQFLQALEHFHQPDSLIVDIGANIGNHTVYFSRTVGARVAAFEPEPHNVLCLEVNARLNEVRDRVTIHRCALGAAAGEVSLTMSIDSNYGSFSAVGPQRPDAAGIAAEASRVPVRRLDQVLDAHHPNHAVSLMKIDVEGMELDVLKGATRTIQRWMPAIACECIDKPVFQRVEALLSRFGYSVVGLFNSTPTFLFCNSRIEAQRAGLSAHLRAQVLRSADSRKGFIRD